MHNRDDGLLIRKCEDKARAADKYGYFTHTGFLDLHEQSLVQERLALPQGITAMLQGGYPESERQMAIFVPDVFSESDLYAMLPIKAIRIDETGRDGKAPSHRDYLGALVGLGLSREKLGDILVDNKGAWVFCVLDIAVFIAENLVQVGRSKVSAYIAECLDVEVTRKFEAITATVASNRLDNIVKAAAHMGRKQASDAIKGGRVFINGRECLKVDCAVEEGKVLSVRGVGKFILAEASQTTKKGRIAIKFHKYI